MHFYCLLYDNNLIKLYSRAGGNLQTLDMLVKVLNNLLKLIKA